MIELPTTLTGIDKLIQDGVKESLHLDYKDSRAMDRGKKDEIAKDVSAFANSDGGLIIYGITEANNLPVAIDGGVDHTKCTREWLEQTVASNITPRIDGIRISVVPLSQDSSIYAVQVPKSARGPHQSADKKYYKRFNFQSVPMEDYEINDVRNRRRTVPPLVNVDVEIRHGIIVYIKLNNVGDQTAEDVKFTWSSGFQAWIDKKSPNLFTRGIKYLPPKRSYSFRYGSFVEALNGGEKSSSFDITVTYLHPEEGQYISDGFHIDLMDYWNSSVRESDTYEIGKKLKESIDKLTEQVQKLNKNLEKISSIAGPTGLDVSVTTLRNLKYLKTGDDQIERINPKYCDYDVFMEVLGVDFKMAHKLSHFFWGEGEKDLNSIEGITDDLAERIRKYFKLDSDD